MSAVDTSQEITIGRDWARSLVLLLTCVFVLVSFSYFMQSEDNGYIDRRARNASYVIVPLFSVFTPLVAFRLFVPFGALLRINPEGFADHRINKKLVPWPEVRNIVARSEFVTVTMSRKFSKSYRTSLSQKLLKRHRKAGPGHLVIARGLLNLAAFDLTDLMRSYCDANGGRSSPPARKRASSTTEGTQ